MMSASVNKPALNISSRLEYGTPSIFMACNCIIVPLVSLNLPSSALLYSVPL